jgi:hypothetical protein
LFETARGADLVDDEPVLRDEEEKPIEPLGAS